VAQGALVVRGEAPAGVGTEAPAASEALARARRWAGILSAYFTAQTLTQLAGIAAGLLFVNFMPVREFALYTLASSVIGFFGFASDLGSTSSLLYFFQRSTTAGTPGRFAAYFAAVLSLRRGAFALGGLFVLIAFPLGALGQGFSAGEALLVAAGILLAVWFQIGASLELLGLRLDDRYRQSYAAEMLGSFLRLLLAVALVLTGWLKAALAVLVAACGSAAVARSARRQVPPPPDAERLAAHRREVLRYLLPTLPSALYFSLQGPLVVWLAATFGSTRNIAEVGALGRLGLVVGMFSGLSSVIFLPRLSRVTDERVYRARCLQYGGLLLALGGLLLAAAAFAPDLFLMLIGPHYAGLHAELLLVVAGAGLSLPSGFAVGVNNARAWTRWQGLAVVALALGQAAFAALVPLGTTAGVLTFNLLSACVGLAAQLVIAALGFVRPAWVHWA
jgi:O-antigen/teichoic acid export membrane protein